MTEEGPKRIKAPCSMISPAGTKRVVYAREDSVWITVHVTGEKDLNKIEEDIIAKTYGDLGMQIEEDDIQEAELIEFITEAKKE